MFPCAFQAFDKEIDKLRLIDRKPKRRVALASPVTLLLSVRYYFPYLGLFMNVDLS